MFLKRKEKRTKNYIFFPILKPLMLSSKISHTAAFVLQHILLPQSSADWFDDDDDDAGDDDVDATTVDDDRDWPNEDLDDAETPPLHFGDDKDDDGVLDDTETEVAAAAAAAIEIPVEAVAGSTRLHIDNT